MTETTYYSTRLRDEALPLERRVEAAKAAAPTAILISLPPQDENRTTHIRVEFVVPPKYPDLALPDEYGRRNHRSGNG